MKIRIGSRDSRLAVIQSEMVIDAIRAYDPTAEVELVTMKTTGDLILDRPLSQIGGKGLFVKELDRALLEGRVDFTVHSSKDLPMDIPQELPLVAFSHRADPRDALVLPQGVDTLDPTRPIGCASLRRTLQLRKLFPHHQVAPVRGNVQTRLAKLDRGEYSALVLACAGLDRLGLESPWRRCSPPPDRAFWRCRAGRMWTRPACPSSMTRWRRCVSPPSGPLWALWRGAVPPLWPPTPPWTGTPSPSPGSMWTVRANLTSKAAVRPAPTPGRWARNWRCV